MKAFFMIKLELID